MLKGCSLFEWIDERITDVSHKADGFAILFFTFKRVKFIVTQKELPLYQISIHGSNRGIFYRR
jgi:hypothetical protein